MNGYIYGFLEEKPEALNIKVIKRIQGVLNSFTKKQVIDECNVTDKEICFKSKDEVFKLDGESNHVITNTIGFDFVVCVVLYILKYFYKEQFELRFEDTVGSNPNWRNALTYSNRLFGIKK